MAIQKQIQVNKGNTKNKSGKATESRALIKQMTPEEFDLVKNSFVKSHGSKEIIRKLGEDLLPSIKSGKPPDKEAIKRAIPTLRKALTAYGLDSHIPLEETADEKYRPLIAEFSYQLIREYDCKTSGEKALAELVVSAYARILLYSQRLNGAMSGESTKISKQCIEYYLMLSKELDRANRHFITALTTLKQLKTPSLEISVKAKTAFVAQNQQLNVNPPNKDNPNNNEIIDSK